MYATEELVTVTLLCGVQMMKAVIDKFGVDVLTELVDESHFQATVTVCPSPTFYRWVFGWGSLVEIEGPEEVREKYREMLEKGLERYNAPSTAGEYTQR